MVSPALNVTAMRVQTMAQQTPSTTTDYGPQRPYRDCEFVHLFETLEAEYDRGEAFSEHIVWELVHRLGEAEAMLREHGLKTG